MYALSRIDENGDSGRKRKSVLTGHAEETAISHFTFNTEHRKHQKQGGPSTQSTKRQKKGDSSIVSGEGAYKGPWAKFENADAAFEEEEEARALGELASDEEYEEDELVPAETSAVPSLYKKPRAPGEPVEEDASETTEFHGTSQYDYQGRTYMHVPQDLDIDLQQPPGTNKNYHPKKLIHTWKHGSKAITALRFFPNSGHLLLSASADSTIKIWDAYHSRELLRSYKGHTKSTNDITFTTSGSHFLSASYDRQMKYWDTEYGKCISSFSTGKIPHCVAFNPSSDLGHEFLAGMSDKKIVQFDTRLDPGPNNSSLVQEYDHHLGPINTITFCDQARRFVTTSDDKSLRAWEYGIPVPIKFIAEPHMYSMVAASAHPSGKYIAFQSGDNQIVVYASTDKFRQNRKKSFRGHNNAGYAIDVSISPDGGMIMSGDSGGFVCFWDWKTCKMWHKIHASDGPVISAQWHPQETSKVATGGLDGLIKYWD
ncbi:MAG: hypothetical protein M4579_003333 [Chaenotheca gracillima]|nr:MAG: hypothetical protein M4579_003333 [Chaenotheca gracillima]